jgi:hypothetical protein
MKRFYQTLCAFLIVSSAMTSCLNNEDSETIAYSNEAAITGFALGKLNCYTNTKSANTGNDTIIKTVLSGDNYPMTVSQTNNIIYNTQEFPLGTDLKHVLISSISTKSNSIALLKSLVSDSCFLIASTDSIDFSQPRVLRVYSTDGTNQRDYTVTLKISTTKGTESLWKKTSTNPLLVDWTQKSLVAYGDSVKLVDKGIVMKGSTAYRANGNSIEKSTDLSSWETVATASIKQLIGASTNELYALDTNGMLKYSQDNGKTWADENLDESASLLPVNDIATTTWAYAPIDSADCVLMGGINQEGSMCFWRKICQKGKEGQWVYMPIEDNNRFTMPAQSNLSMAYVGGDIYATGSGLTIYVSRDQGITWKIVSSYELPSDAQGTEYVITADTQGNLWLVTNAGQIWKK